MPSAALFALLVCGVIGACGSTELEPQAEQVPLVSPELAADPRPEVQACLPDAAELGQLPEHLSQTGCFVSLAPLVPSADLIPYAVVSPLWTDGTDKSRFIALPPGESVAVLSDESWLLPVGSVVIKHFALDLADDGIAGVRPVESRVMARAETDWLVATYLWNDEATEASRLDEDRVTPLVAIQGGERVAIDYLFPAPGTCLACHRDTQVGTIGLTSGQLARSEDYAHGRADQLAVLTELNVLESATEPAVAYVDPADRTAELEARVRSYLDANCAHCHRPGGYTPPDLGLDLRLATALSDTGLCDPLRYASPFVPGEVRVVPGHPEESNVYLRMTMRGDGQMPLVGSALVDPLADALLNRWITSLDSCD